MPRRCEDLCVIVGRKSRCANYMDNPSLRRKFNKGHGCGWRCKVHDPVNMGDQRQWIVIDRCSDRTDPGQLTKISADVRGPRGFETTRDLATLGLVDYARQCATHAPTRAGDGKLHPNQVPLPNMRAAYTSEGAE
ncbi:hypothetical protein FHS85_000229 [Rhodoligotrophos appendicifer]